MKKISILALAGLFAMGLVACEKKGTEGENGNTTGANGTTQPSDPNANGGNNVNTPPASDLPLTTVSFSEESHNFGMIKEGEVVSHTFKFKNTGTQPLRIDNVKPSCGCTTPDWTKEDVPPGGEGFVKVEFNSAGKTGVQKKSVTVTANTEPRTKMLNFSGEVVSK